MTKTTDERQSREERMVVLERDGNGKPTVWCDPEIADIVGALNSAGVRTIASCSGHGYRPGSIALADGRWLVIAKDDAEFNQIEAIFPTDINGEPTLRAQGGVRVLQRIAAILEHPSGSPEHDLGAVRQTLSSLEASPAPVSEEVVDQSFAGALSDHEVRIWISACNHEPARQALRQLLAYRLRGVSAALAAKGGQ